MASQFTDEDSKQYEKLDKLITELVQWKNPTTKELIQTYQSLVWFAGLRTKIKDHIFEVKSVKTAEELKHNVPEATKAKARSKKSKSAAGK